MSVRDPKATLRQIRDAARHAREICSNKTLEGLLQDWQATAALERLAKGNRPSPKSSRRSCARCCGNRTYREAARLSEARLHRLRWGLAATSELPSRAPQRRDRRRGMKTSAMTSLYGAKEQPDEKPLRSCRLCGVNSGFRKRITTELASGRRS